MSVGGVGKYLDQLTAGKSSGSVSITCKMAVLDRAVYFYGQMYGHPLVKETIGASNASAEHQTLFQTLHLLTYGTWKDVTSKKAPASVIEFVKGSKELTTKLRQLSLLTIAEKQKNISYSTVATELDIASGSEQAREIEDVIIDATTAGLLTVTLSPQERRIQVHDAAARDVDVSEIADLLNLFSAWGTRCQLVVTELQKTKAKCEAAEKEETERIVRYATTEALERKKALRSVVEAGAQKHASSAM